MIWGFLSEAAMKRHIRRDQDAWITGYDTGRSWFRPAVRDKPWQSWLAKLVKEPRTSRADIRAISDVIERAYKAENLPRRSARTAFINGFKFAVAELAEGIRDEILRREGHVDPADRARIMKAAGFYQSPAMARNRSERLVSDKGWEETSLREGDPEE